MNKNITSGVIARQKIKTGVDTIANAVKATLGPKGRNVVIQSTYGAPHITKDGVTVAKHIDLKDPIENLAAQVMKQAATKTVSKCGDGTTTSLILAQAIYNEGYKLIEMGITSPIEIKNALYKELPTVIQQIENKAIPINNNKERIIQVATIAANNDSYIGELIANAFEQVGENGIVQVEESKGTSTYIELTDGTRFDRGYISPYFINTPNKLSVELENPYILFYDKKIRAANDIVPILQIIAKQGRPLLIVAEEVEAQALSLLIVNRLKANLQVAAVRAPAFGERRLKVLEDLAILTNGQVITESAGKTLAQVTLKDLGQCDKVVISKMDTTIIQSKSNPEGIEDRINLIKEEITQAGSEYNIQKNKERIAMLLGKVAILNIGALTEVELKEKKDRIEDALQATQAALKLGIVPGGGKVYFDIANNFLAKNMGTDILSKALKTPIQAICDNANTSYDVINSILSNSLEGYGYNALTNTYEDLLQNGVIDPVLVLIIALENAISVACMLLLTEVTITMEQSSLPQQDMDYEGYDQ